MDKKKVILISHGNLSAGMMLSLIHIYFYAKKSSIQRKSYSAGRISWLQSPSAAARAEAILFAGLAEKNRNWLSADLLR